MRIGRTERHEVGIPSFEERRPWRIDGQPTGSSCALTAAALTNDAIVSRQGVPNSALRMPKGELADVSASSRYISFDEILTTSEATTSVKPSGVLENPGLSGSRDFGAGRVR
jgi:hypothetical protein